MYFDCGTKLQLGGGGVVYHVDDVGGADFGQHGHSACVCGGRQRLQTDLHNALVRQLRETGGDAGARSGACVDCSREECGRSGGEGGRDRCQ